jgi:putative zinc finger/helix-turn-helix YgiT family protein
MQCLTCNKAEMEPADVEARRVVAGHTFTAVVHGLRCPACGAEEVEATELRRFERAIARELAAGQPSGAGVTFIRKILGYTKAQLADLFGVGSGVVTSWETERSLIDRAAWTLLGLLLADQSGTEATLRASALPKDLPDRVVLKVA